MGQAREFQPGSEAHLAFLRTLPGVQARLRSAFDVVESDVCKLVFSVAGTKETQDLEDAVKCARLT